jgi:hypothetical protein
VSKFDPTVINSLWFLVMVNSQSAGREGTTLARLALVVAAVAVAMLLLRLIFTTSGSSLLLLKGYSIFI